MALAPGTRLGPYEIQSLVGSGGMGEVYRATDTRLNRTLAIKVLPSHVADLPERRRRFDREARAVASLNHPHICHLHDVGHDAGVDFLVLEYLDVLTLGDRLLNGPLPLADVLRYAIEIADALDHAHRRGLVHRDLKPANVMVTESGIKVLDFGLAKFRPVDSLPAISTVAVESSPLTGDDAVLGTFQYMAPEQLEGQEADARTDIFAFGAIVYEMATGRKAFEGKTAAATIAATLRADVPPMPSLVPTIPPSLDRVIARCLAKDPDDRWQTARDLLLELKWIANDGAAAPRRTPAGRLRWNRHAVLGVTAAILAISTLALTIVYWRQSVPDPRVVRLSVLPPDPSSDFALSPDGRHLAFVTGHDDAAVLWIRSLDSTTARAVAGAEGAHAPFWSPDSRFVAFGSAGKLKKVAAGGGPIGVLCDARVVLGGSWGRDDVIVFARNNREPLYRVSAAGGEPVPATELDPSQGHNTHRWPSFLPDGRRFLYLARSSSRPENSGIYLGSLDALTGTRVLAAESSVAYAQPGWLVFARDGKLLAQAVDPSDVRPRGGPIQVLEDVRYGSDDSYAAFSLSANAEMAYQASGAISRSRLVWVDRAGTPLPSSTTLDGGDEPSISPDGTRVVATRVIGVSRDIWLVDSTLGVSRVISGPWANLMPVWSPDGTSIVFSSNRDGPADLYRAPASGTGDVTPLLKSALVKHPTDWSRDGGTIVYDVHDPETGYDLWTWSRRDGSTKPLLQTKFAEGFGRLSPDSRWIAYVSNESGANEVYVQPFPPSDGRWKISTNGGTEPRWRRDGMELFYLTDDGKMMAVSVRGGSMFQYSTPKTLFEKRISANGEWAYDVSADGRTFVISEAVGDPGPAPIDVVLNWTLGLPR